MSYGLRVTDNSGKSIEIGVDRLQRIIGTYTYSISSGNFLDITIPTFVDDGTWSVVICPLNAPSIVPPYTRYTGYVHFYNPFYETLSGFILVLRQ
jgi:hypothetical protein